MSEDAVRIVVGDRDDSPKIPRPPHRLLLAVIITLVAGAVIWAAASQDATEVDEALVEVPTTDIPVPDIGVATVTAPFTSATGPAISWGPPTTVPISTEVSVILLGGATALEGDVALAQQPSSLGGGMLWVVGAGGSLVRMDDVPFWPGDYPYPMLMTSGQIAFANLTDGFLIDADLIDNPEPVTEASFVIPGATPGLVWFIGPGSEWVAAVDVESRTVGERIDVTGVFRWPIAGVADGLIVKPVDEQTFGRDAYWSPSEGLRSLALDLQIPQQRGVIAASGDLAVVITPNELAILNIVTGDILSAFRIEFSEGLLSSVCLSPDQKHIAIIGTSGETFLGDTEDGSFIELPTLIHGWKSIGWTSNTQLVYVIDTELATLVQTFDISTGETHDIAMLQSLRGWTLAASGSMC